MEWHSWKCHASLEPSSSPFGTPRTKRRVSVKIQTPKFDGCSSAAKVSLWENCLLTLFALIAGCHRRRGPIISELALLDHGVAYGHMNFKQALMRFCTCVQTQSELGGDL